MNALVGVGQFDVSRTGTLVYRKASGGASAMMTLQWVDPTGRRNRCGPNPACMRIRAFHRTASGSR